MALLADFPYYLDRMDGMLYLSFSLHSWRFKHVNNSKHYYEASHEFHGHWISYLLQSEKESGREGWW